MKKSVLLLAAILSFSMLSACGKKEETGLYSYKTEYVGDNSKVSSIAGSIKYPEGFSESSIKIQSEKEPYTLDVYLDCKGDTDSVEFFDQAVLTFALIGNLQVINYINKENNEIIDSYQRDSIEVVLRENGEKSLQEIGSSQDEIDEYMANMDK